MRWVKHPDATAVLSYEIIAVDSTARTFERNVSVNAMDAWTTLRPCLVSCPSVAGSSPNAGAWGVWQQSYSRGLVTRSL